MEEFKFRLKDCISDHMTKRIFAAIDISDKAKVKVAEYLKNLKSEFADLRVGWEKTEKLHLTLKFFGDVEIADLKTLNNAIVETAGQFSKFNLQTSTTGAFPSPAKAQVLWIGIEDKTKSLQNLAEIFEANCVKHGFAREARNFKAHLTVARLREPEKSRELVEKHLRGVIEPIRFEVSEIVIYESQLQKSCSIYSVVLRQKLKEILSTDKHG